MAKKEKMVQDLNAVTKPYNLQVIVGAPKLDKQTGNAIEHSVTVNLTIMDKARQIDGRLVQPTHRNITTTGFGTSIDDAKRAALTEALQFAGVI